MKGIRQRRVDLMTLKLSPEEGFVLSRVDGTATVRELAALTGFDEPRILAIVDRLRAEGAVEIEALDPGPSGASARPPTSSPVEAELLAFLSDAPGPVDEAEPVRDAPLDQDSANRADETSEPEEPEAESASEATDEERAVDEHERMGEREYRKIYESTYHPMTRDLRVKAATEASGSHLMALCLDADPQVIVSVLANTRTGLEHARFIAQHQRTQIGLEAVAKRTEFLADSHVQRRLLRNPQLPTTILGRILNPKMLLDVYKVAIDREIPERTRLMTRETLRKKFMVSSSDERAALLSRTEGRCLLLLTACTLDAHATQILCAKPNYTSMFVQNLARWTATPPMLLVHLLKNPVVRRNLGLKKMLLRHPNTPSDAKRNAV